jgi:Leishmanolysin
MAFNFGSIDGKMWNWGSNAARSSASTYSKQVINGYNYLFITLPNVYVYAKNYFKCHDAGSYTGMPLTSDQNATPVQVWWDRKYAFFDIMAVDISINPVVTMFTMIMLSDSGWYEVDLDYATPTTWGQGYGCSIFNKSLDNTNCGLTVDEFAGPINKQICSRDYKSKGSFDASTGTDRMDLCPVFRRKSAFVSDSLDCTNMNRSIVMDTMTLILQEYYGPDSRCFISVYSNSNLKLNENATNLEIPSCQKFQCTKSNGRYALRIIFDNQWIDCPYYGGTVSLRLGIYS